MVNNIGSNRNMAEEVIITGGAGFFGSHVAKLMLDIGYKVIVFDDFSNGKNMHLKDLKDNTKLSIIKGDLTKKRILKILKNLLEIQVLLFISQF